ncbi:SLATT domain-containing protein [candidate division WOR-3 bacterium]|uniref:SLATT domain-containing protein n=1 Tax=candidate division WOR-3 bacterium TaxID=2052148 RepID=A0A937XGU3_UNCW3|nr:SLATT domain-containing protein [candidate division WOR-3 bacterium]
MTANVKSEFANEARRIEEDALHSSKGHHEAARLWTNFHYSMGVPTVLMAAVAGAAALTQFDYSGIIAGILAILVTGMTAVTTFIDPCAKASSHQVAATKYSALRNSVRLFHRVELFTDEAESSLLKRLKEFSQRRDELNHDSPQIPRWAYLRARKGIEAGEADHEVDSHDSK